MYIYIRIYIYILYIYIHIYENTVVGVLIFFFADPLGIEHGNRTSIINTSG